MNSHRLRVVPREGNREAQEMFTYHLKRDGYMYCDERLDMWHVYQPNTGINFWVHPTDDPMWEVIY